MRKVIGNIEAAETKRALSFHSAMTLTPSASVALIGSRVRTALGRLPELKPYKVTEPVTVDVSFKNYQPSQLLALLPMFERTDSHSVRFRSRNMVEASNIMQFIGDYRADITP